MLKLNLPKPCIWLMLIIVAAALSSCIKSNKIIPGSITNITVNRITLNGIDVQLSLPIQNLNGSALQINSAEVVIAAGKKNLAHIALLKPITLFAHSNDTYVLTLHIDLVNNGNMLELVKLINYNTPLTADGNAQVQYWVFNKRMRIHRDNLQQFVVPAVQRLNLF